MSRARPRPSRTRPPTSRAIAAVLEGEVLIGEDAELAGRVWVHSMDVSSPSGISDGDIAVIGNRDDAQRLALDLGAALLVLSNGSRPSDEILELARERGTAR